MDKDKTITTTIVLPRDVHATAKALAAYNHVSLTEFVELALCFYIQERPARPPTLPRVGAEKECTNE
jgi:hypothetical protein